jgi:decaprenylphospho-beta-D-ribofuranose 2-oxidase
MKISNWGNYPVVDGTLKSFRYISELEEDLASFQDCIARGMGRCYGDSSLWNRVSSTLLFNRMLAFDDAEGVFSCESGVSLQDILEVIVPRGWFLPVTPGTKYVSVGGAIASDVHGKNHHKVGSFADWVLSLDVMLGTGELVTCSKEKRADVFHAVCGGMGLIGIIVKATFRLMKIESAFIKQTTIRARSLDEIMDLFGQHKHASYSLAWIDSLSRGGNLGRSILILGEHALKEEIKDANGWRNSVATNQKNRLLVPFYFPSFVLNKYSAMAFNQLYYYKYPRSIAKSFANFDSFFYPLDSIVHWNRVYGQRGFLQYQFVLPKEESRKGMRKILHKISDSGYGSFLGVLKLFGKGNENLLSFPMEGYTMALDFPFTPSLLKFLITLDKEVLDCGGRLYLAKDARMNGEMFRRSYKNADNFLHYKHTFDEGNKFRSLQSQRLDI